ncbi:MAG: hypothetical protein HOH16_09070 [Planctomycetaceae bacterium]|nr:hypothetical protein [Planctomycetaceae bacterium]
MHSVGLESSLYGGLLVALHFLFEGWHCCLSQSGDGVQQTGLGTGLAEESA